VTDLGAGRPSSHGTTGGDATIPQFSREGGHGARADQPASSGQAGRVVLPRLLRVAQVAEILDVSVQRAYELARIGTLPVVRVGRQVRVDPLRLREWIRAGGCLGLVQTSDKPDLHGEMAKQHSNGG
jgi:excisionase family DNA binding protein